MIRIYLSTKDTFLLIFLLFSFAVISYYFGYFLYNPLKNPSHISRKVSDLLNQAHKFDEEGKYEEAIKIYKKASKIQPDNPEVYFLWGSALHHQNRCLEAIEKYGKSLQINRENALVYAARAICYAVLGKYREAVGDFEKATLLEPDKGWPFLYWGLFLERYLKEYKEAKGKYQKASEVFQRTKHLKGEKEAEESLMRIDSLIKGDKRK